jgi:hypothetical protein
MSIGGASVINGIFPSAYCFKGKLNDFYFILLIKLVLKEGIHAFIYNFEYYSY